MHTHPCTALRSSRGRRFCLHCTSTAGTGKKLGKEATKLSSTWCKMMTALNNNKCIPLFQLALYASDPPAELPQAAGSGVLGAGTTAAAAASPAAAGVGASAVLATAPGGAGGAGQHQQGQGQAPAKPSLLPLLQAVLEDVGSREGMLEGILMARSKDGGFGKLVGNASWWLSCVSGHAHDRFDQPTLMPA